MKSRKRIKRPLYPSQGVGAQQNPTRKGKDQSRQHIHTLQKEPGVGEFLNGSPLSDPDWERALGVRPEGSKELPREPGRKGKRALRSSVSFM